MNRKKEAEDSVNEGRYIRLPPELWAKVEDDARRCRRSVTKQVEAILADYVALEVVDLRRRSDTANVDDDDGESHVTPIENHYRKTRVS